MPLIDRVCMASFSQLITKFHVKHEQEIRLRISNFKNSRLFIRDSNVEYLKELVWDDNSVKIPDLSQFWA